MKTRLVSFAGASLSIKYSGPRPTKIVDFLYQYLSPGSRHSPQLTYRLLPGDKPGRLVLYRGQTLLYAGDSEAVVAELLLGDTCHHLAAQSRGGMLFHAAGLAWQGQGLLLPGAIGAGKSTLAAWLLSRGFDYLTDELVFVPQGMEAMQTFTRPLNLKRPARPVWQNLFDFAGQTAHIFSSPHGDLIPPTLFRPANTLSEPPLNLIIFPLYQPGSDFVWRPLSRAQAGLELMQCLVNARNLPGYGFAEIARLARAAPAYQMRYADFAQLGQRVENLLRPL
jgi:hypothetical protein